MFNTIAVASLLIVALVLALLAARSTDRGQKRAALKYALAGMLFLIALVIYGWGRPIF